MSGLTKNQMSSCLVKTISIYRDSKVAKGHYVINDLAIMVVYMIRVRTKIFVYEHGSSQVFKEQFFTEYPVTSNKQT